MVCWGEGGGAEGPSDNTEIVALRERQKRNFLATLTFSQGIPMLLSGDEIGRTQLGNNNAYCQDNEISWVDWDLDNQSKKKLLEFVRYIIGLRKRHPVLHRSHFFQGRRIRGSEVKDLTWFRTDGKEMTEQDWENPETHCIGLRLAGDAIDETDERGKRITDDTLLILLNSYHGSVDFVLPQTQPGESWEMCLDTGVAIGKREFSTKGGGTFHLGANSLVMFCVMVKGETKHKGDSAGLKN